MRRIHIITTLAVAALGACTDPVDKAAKARIFSPEDPPQAVSSAKERLPPQDVASDPRIARRILGMGAAEATERLGAHRYFAQLSFEWLNAQGKSVKLEETRTLATEAGGYAGDFHATLQNSNDQGLELIRADGKVYARSRYGTFRHRKRDRGLAERTRDEVYGAIRDFDTLFQGRLLLKPQETVTLAGRTAWKYDVDLGKEAPPLDTGARLPPPAYPKDGPDPDTRRRLAFFEKRTPQSLNGEIFVDAETSVVLKARLAGTLTAPGLDGGTATVRLAMTSEVQEVGMDPAIAPPKDFLPDADKPQGIADALDQFGIDRGASGAEEAPAPAEPEDEG